MEIELGFEPHLFILVLARVAAVVGGSVIFGRGLVSPRIRAGMALVLAIVITPLVPRTWGSFGTGISNVPQLVFAVMGEVLLGAVIALISEVFVSILRLAGHIISFCSSLTMSRAIDPLTGVSSNILGELLQLVFLMLLLIANGHLVLIRMLIGSFQTVPPHLGWMSADLLVTLVSMGSMMFEWALRFAAPAMAGVLIIDAGFGLISRMAPDFNVLFLSLPVRLFCGLAIFGLMLRMGGDSLHKVVEYMLAYCGHILAR